MYNTRVNFYYEKLQPVESHFVCSSFFSYLGYVERECFYQVVAMYPQGIPPSQLSPGKTMELKFGSKSLAYKVSNIS